MCLFSDSSASCCNVILLSLLMLAFVLLGLLLYHRFARFTYRRFVTIYRYYLYNEIWNKKAVKYIRRYTLITESSKRH